MTTPLDSITAMDSEQAVKLFSLTASFMSISVSLFNLRNLLENTSVVDSLKSRSLAPEVRKWWYLGVAIAVGLGLIAYFGYANYQNNQTPETPNING